MVMYSQQKVDIVFKITRQGLLKISNPSKKIKMKKDKEQDKNMPTSAGFRPSNDGMLAGEGGPESAVQIGK